MGWIWYLFHGIWFLSCVITCSDCYPLSNQINLLMVINIRGIIKQCINSSRVMNWHLGGASVIKLAFVLFLPCLDLSWMFYFCIIWSFSRDIRKKDSFRCLLLLSFFICPVLLCFKLNKKCFSVLWTFVLSLYFLVTYLAVFFVGAFFCTIYHSLRSSLLFLNKRPFYFLFSASGYPY